MDLYSRRSSIVLVFGAAIAAVALSIFTTGCGRQAYVTTSSAQMQAAPGGAMVPPKVDILLAEDDTGSINEVYPSIANQMPEFLKTIENKGWDYHFATIPLTTDRALTQIAASKYDANQGAAWVAPYPGAVASFLENVSPSVFRPLGQFTGFMSITDITNNLNGLEPGLETINKALYNRSPGTGFLRSDALLVIFVVGNGDDTSGVTFCRRPDGYMGACEKIGYPSPSSVSGLTCMMDGAVVSCPAQGTWDSSLNNYASQLSALKSSPSQIQVHAAVSATQTSYCLGGAARIGSRYQQMASAFGGKSYNVCSQPISSVLDSLSNSLQATRINFRTRYLFIDREPNVATIKVTRYASGVAGNAVDVPQDPVNGWTYAGYLTNAYAIDYPIPMSSATGYAIELHGSAKLIGSDTASVEYTPAGSQSSVAH